MSLGVWSKKKKKERLLPDLCIPLCMLAATLAAASLRPNNACDKRTTKPRTRLALHTDLTKM